MNRNGQNVRQRSRVQGAWSQPQSQRSTSQLTHRAWQPDSSKNEYKTHPETQPSGSSTCQQHLLLYGHGLQQSSKDTRNADSLEPKMPKNFSWVVDGQICAMGFPGEPENILYLIQNNVKYLISLTAEREPPVEGFPDLTLISVKVVDFTPPSIEQVEQCLSIFEKAGQEGKAVGINCAYGRGRTGTVLACYLIKHHNMNGAEAINQIRMFRPGSIETKEQELLIEEFSQHIKFQQTK